MKKGPKKGSKFCDIIEMVKFLQFLKTPQTYYSTRFRVDSKKFYRYLRYALKLGLVSLHHVEKEKHKFPAKYYVTTEKGIKFVECLNIEFS